MPRQERLAIQGDLAWLGYYEGPPGGDFDDRTIAAVKSFQQANGAKPTGLLDAGQRAHLAAAVPARQRAVGWHLIDDAATGARFGMPDRLLARIGDLPTGSAFASGHGQIQVKSFGLSEAGLPALFAQQKRTPRGRYVAASTLGPDSFVISGTQGLKYFIVRAQADAGRVRGITILYDQATRGTMESVAIAMADSFDGFPDGAAPPGGQRTLEYGTAVVADGNGDLLTSADMTAGCTAFAVPPLGYAGLVAADPANAVALLRLYGARGLAPAAFAGGDASSDGALVLVGIADPRAQNGGQAASEAPAHLERNAIAPVPQAGFSGAAALDAQGRFAGIVDLKPAGAAGPAAAVLVPAASVAAFLAAHDVAIDAHRRRQPAAKSVLRIICLREARQTR